MTWRLFPTLALAIGGLSALDRFLAVTEASEVRNAARHSYVEGSRLWSRNDAEEALEPLRNAHALDRDNVEYERQLAGVLLSLRKNNEADLLVEDILRKRPNDGRGNLIAGRLAAMEGDSAGAKAYYHRAIFGDWPNDSGPSRIAAREELIRLLIAEHANQELLSEVISLDAEGVQGEAIRSQVAQWYATAGAPARSAGVYRELTEQYPNDTTVWAGLGEAELKLGNFREARRAFERAGEAPRVEMADLLVGLDPTPRHLAAAEKYRRSLAILSMAKADLERVAPGSETGDAVPPDAVPPKDVSNEAAEQVLAMAEGVWKRRLQAGGPVRPDEEALRLTIEKLSK